MSARRPFTGRFRCCCLTRRLEQLEDRLSPAVSTWDGGGANANWTTAANWVGDVAPHAGDALVFPEGAAQLANVNDFPAGTALHSIKIGRANYNLTGNTVALAAGLTGGSVTGLPLTLTADQAFTGFGNLLGSVDLNGHTLSVIGEGGTFSGPITGTGSLIVSGGTGLSAFAGTVLSGVSTFAGPTTVSGKTLQLDGTLSAAVLVQESPFGTLRGSGTVGDVTVNGGLRPGASNPPFFDIQLPGTLKTGNLSLASTAGTQFSLFASDSANALVVTGTVQLGGSLRIVPVFPYQPEPGDRFTLISNDSTDPVVGTFAGVPEGGTVAAGNTLFQITYRGGDGNDVVATAEAGAPYAVGAGPGGFPVVNVYGADGHLIRSFFAYDPAFRGGVRVATGDVTGDRVPDIITAPGPGGGPHVRVFDGNTFAVVRQFMAYDPAFSGGVNVAAADLTGDFHAEIITGAGPGGGPHVKVFEGATGGMISSFFAYDTAFRGGVSVAGTDKYFVSTGYSDGSIITGAGPGGGPHVRVFTSAGALTSEFFAYDPLLRGGVNVASRLQVRRLPDDTLVTIARIVTAPASRSVADVRVFGPTGQPIGGFTAYDASFFGGATVAVEAMDANGTVTVVTGAGPGGGPHVKTWQVVNGTATLQQEFFAFDPAFRGGVFVG